MKLSNKHFLYIGFNTLFTTIMQNTITKQDVMDYAVQILQIDKEKVATLSMNEIIAKYFIDIKDLLNYCS